MDTFVVIAAALLFLIIVVIAYKVNMIKNIRLKLEFGKQRKLGYVFDYFSGIGFKCEDLSRSDAIRKLGTLVHYDDIIDINGVNDVRVPHIKYNNYKRLEYGMRRLMCRPKTLLYNNI